MKDLEDYLAPMLENLLAEGIAECLDCGLKKTTRAGFFFEENESLRGMYSCTVRVEVSPNHRSEPWNVEALVYAGRQNTSCAWREVCSEGQWHASMGEVAASCEAELRREKPALFEVYDALRQHAQLDADTDGGSSPAKTKRL